MDKQLTILIVDDVAINRAILKGIFEGEYRIIEADDGTSALEILRGPEQVDIILLDIIMPKMNGIEFLRIIKSEKAFCEIPVIVNTQAGEQENEYKALELGAADFIVKPYNPKVVKRRISNIIEKYIYQKTSLEQTIRDTTIRLETLIDTVPGGIGIFDVSDQIKLEYYNDGLGNMLGYSRREMEGHKDEDMLTCVYKPDQQIIKELIEERVQKKAVNHCKVRIKRKDGKLLWVGISGKWIFGDDGKQIFHAVLMDLTEEKETEIQLKNSMTELKYRAERDTLTGIYNRETFYRETEKLLQDNPEEDYVLGQWNIDRFKVVNELFGTRTGDQILCSFANLLQTLVGKSGICGRLEADHFVCCIPQRKLQQKMSFIEKFLSGEGDWNQFNYPILSHVGFYKIEDSYMAVNLMCDRAAMALGMVKGNYIKRWDYYNERLKESILNEQELINDMEIALLEKQFLVYYQPIVDSKTRQIVSAEALVRWKHPLKGMISPGLFIPLFEKNGFIAKLDMYVCREVCRHQSEQRKAGNVVVPISVNLSRINFYDAGLCAEILEYVKQYGIKTSDIKLEITESAYQDNLADLTNAITLFQKAGFKVLMDDFGSGYSSLNMLKDVTVDILKIDMKFMDNLEKSERASNILFSIVKMAKALEMETVVEGVETENQFELLSGMGCESIQGYYFYRPLPEEEFLSELNRKHEMRSTQTNSHPQTVLIVDDIEMNRASIREVIKEKYNVLEAEDGVQALKVLKMNFNDISLVVSDIRMPNMSGFELIEEMQKITFLRNIPILMVTAYGERENEIRALELGALDVVTKPYDPEILQKRIENLMKISENEKTDFGYMEKRKDRGRKNG